MTYEIGAILDERFRLDRELGAGAFGTVFEATQLVLGRPFRRVALKLLNDNPGATFEKRFQDVITLGRILSEIGGRDIRRFFVEVHDLFVLQGPTDLPVIVMELVAGTTLQRVIYPRSGPGQGGFTPEMVLHYMLPVCRALEFMHTHDAANPVLHLDLKPDNILVTSDDSVKVADFGLATDVASLHGGRPQAGALLYLAPEVLVASDDHRVYTPRVDVYALGLVMYEMLVGELPRKGAARGVGGAGAVQSPTLSDSLWHASQSIPPLDQHPRGILLGEGRNRELAEIVSRCLAFEPLARFRDARQLRQALDDFRDGIAPVAQNESPETRPETVLRNGEHHRRQGRYNEAKACFERVIELSPKDPSGYLALAEMELDDQRPEAALDHLKKCLKETPEEARTYLMMARAFADLNHDSVAAEFRNKARELT